MYACTPLCLPLQAVDVLSSTTSPTPASLTARTETKRGVAGDSPLHSRNETSSEDTCTLLPLQFTWRREEEGEEKRKEEEVEEEEEEEEEEDRGGEKGERGGGGGGGGGGEGEGRRGG